MRYMTCCLSMHSCGARHECIIEQSWDFKQRARRKMGVKDTPRRLFAWMFVSSCFWFMPVRWDHALSGWDLHSFAKVSHRFTKKHSLVGLECDIAIELSRDHQSFIVSANGSFSSAEIQFLSAFSNKTGILWYAVGKWPMVFEQYEWKRRCCYNL